MIRDPLEWMPLAYKLPLALVLLAVTTLAITGLITAGNARNVVEQQVTRQLDLLATSEATTVSHQLDLLQRRLEDFCSDGYIRQQTSLLQIDPAPGDVREEARRALRHHLVTNKLPLVGCFVGCCVVGENGQPLATVTAPPPGSAGVPNPLTETWAGPLRTPTAEHPYPVFLIGSPLQDLNRERRVGALIIVVRADQWLASFERPAMKATLGGMGALLQDANGIEMVLPRRADPLAAPLHAPFTTATGTRNESDEPAGSRLQLRRPLPGTDWTVVVEADEATVMQPVEDVMGAFTLTAALVLLSGTVLLAVLVQFVLRPIARLRDSATRIANGDLDVEVRVDTRDEIGQLARAFQTMTRAVRERSHQLEDQATELRRTEAAVRTERDRLDGVIRSMDDGLFILDANGTVTLANDAARPVLDKLDHVDLPSRLVCHNLAPGAKSCAECLLHWRTAAEPCVLRIDERIHEIAITAMPGGGSSERVFVSRDVTERIRQTQIHAHQERMAVVGRIAAVMAHELNNPLSAIAMFSQALESDLPEDSPLREHAEIIRRNTERCATSIRTLLESATQAPPEVEELDVHDLLEDVALFLEPLVRKGGARVALALQADRTEVSGDERYLRQVFVNLLMNAVQAGGDGTTVHIESRDADELLEIDVIDDGPGLPEDLHEAIFRPFFTTKPPGTGTGLGLPTSRQLVEAHGGALELVESRPGRTVFRVTLDHRVQPERIRLELTTPLLSSTDTAETAGVSDDGRSAAPGPAGERGRESADAATYSSSAGDGNGTGGGSVGGDGTGDGYGTGEGNGDGARATSSRSTAPSRTDSD